MSSKWDSNEIIQRFREYLRIPSVHPDIDYGDCVKFLRQQADQLGLPAAVHELVPGKPVVVITWTGSEPRLPAIMLNSHMDVVPVYEPIYVPTGGAQAYSPIKILSQEHWTHPPFSAHVTSEGWIYGRGAQDMKSVGMIHLEAVRRIKDAGGTLKRTVHITFVPDEETGSVDGMRVFTESQIFKDLNVGFEMDESAPHDQPDVLYIFNGERTSRQIKVTCKGEPGHGSFLPANTAGEKIHYIIEKFMRLRAEEKQKLDEGTVLGDVTSVNLTELSGGVQINVLPESLSVSFDIRIAPHVDHGKFEKMIDTWCEEAGKDVTYEYIVKNPQIPSTRVDNSVPYWTALRRAVEDMGLKVVPLTCPGATDARFVRRQGVPAINLTPIVNTPLLLHCHDERLHVNEFLRGIDIMEKILEAIANVP